MFPNNNNGGMSYNMPVQPFYGNNGGLFGGNGGSDLIALLFILALCGGGWGGFGGFGWGGMGLGMMGAGMGLGYDFPWLMTGQQGINNNINGAARDQMIGSKLDAISAAQGAGFSQLQLGQAGLGRDICQTGNTIVAAVTGGFSAAESAENARQLALLQQLFGIQSAQQACCCENRQAIADVKYTIATEAANTRAASSADKQQILDKLCQLELDGVRQNYETRILGMQSALDASRAENQALRFERSQTAQNAYIAQEINNQNEIFYNRLKNCPVNAVPVAGNTPLFSCNPSFNTPGCGCGGGYGYGYAAA